MNKCNLSYVGQTSRRLKIRYQEHIRYIRSKNPVSIRTAQHWCNNTNKGKLHYLERNPTQYHFAHLKSHVDGPKDFPGEMPACYSKKL